MHRIEAVKQAARDRGLYVSVARPSRARRVSRYTLYRVAGGELRYVVGKETLAGIMRHIGQAHDTTATTT